MCSFTTFWSTIYKDMTFFAKKEFDVEIESDRNKTGDRID